MADPIQVVRSRDRLKRVRGGRDGLYPFLENLTWDVVSFFDDFIGDTINPNYGTDTGSDGAIAILADGIGGTAEIRASDGNGADAEHCGISLGLNWSGELNAVMACRLQIDNIATVKVEVGFTDVGSDNGAVNSLSGNTFTASDAAVWVLDTLDTANWQIAATQNGTPVTKIEPGVPPVAATYETLIVQLRDTNAKFWRLEAGGGVVFESDWVVNAITANIKLSPWVLVQLRTGTIDRNLLVDFIDVRGRRTT